MVNPSIFREVFVNELAKPMPSCYDTNPELWVNYCVEIAEMAEDRLKKHFKRGEDGKDLS